MMHPENATNGTPTIPGIDIVNTKSEIVKDWLPRYTGRSLDEFGKFILLSNFVKYVEMFAERFGVEVMGRAHPMQSATAENLTILNFGMGSAHGGDRDGPARGGRAQGRAVPGEVRRA